MINKHKYRNYTKEELDGLSHEKLVQMIVNEYIIKEDRLGVAAMKEILDLRDYISYLQNKLSEAGIPYSKSHDSTHVRY